MKHLKFVDAHIHLSDKEYMGNIEKIVLDAKNSNVAALVSNSMNLKTSIKSLELAERYNKVVYAALGIHPWNVNTLTEEELRQTSGLIIKQKSNKAFIAIGEVGLDYKYERVWNKQLMVFEEMLRLAEKLDLPAIIHSRGTTSQIVEMLPSYNLEKVVLHWFSSPINALPKAVERGYYISEGPPAVYSNGVREVVKNVPLTNLLTETDGPVRYFKSPFDGKMTTPSFIPTVVKAIADIKRINVKEAARQIASNFEEFFKVNVNSNG